ncbi:hypothetical protein [Chryseobacterium sp. 2987]|uniref:hypothetical protein n=1 Tax=Chryseobacterium sp. 2987 TaxID=2817767 RepID=UPI00286725CE|nr:hypothetical protein [Chryseobacterium sp. 2987]MDR6919920.1 hypothetical protein [Chryseobacterium sp. 2987]
MWYTVSPTNLQRTSGFLIEKIVTPLISQPADKAALPTLLAATDPIVKNGSYWGPSGFMHVKGSPGPASIPKQAKDVTTGNRLWQVGEQMTGVKFNLQP